MKRVFFLKCTRSTHPESVERETDRSASGCDFGVAPLILHIDIFPLCALGLHVLHVHTQTEKLQTSEFFAIEKASIRRD